MRCSTAELTAPKKKHLVLLLSRYLEQILEQYPAVCMGVVLPPLVPNEVTTHPASATSVEVSGHAAGLQEDTWGAELCNCALLTHGQEIAKSVLLLPLSLPREPRENGAVPTAAKRLELLVPGLFQTSNASATRKTTPRI